MKLVTRSHSPLFIVALTIILVISFCDFSFATNASICNHTNEQVQAIDNIIDNEDSPISIEPTSHGYSANANNTNILAPCDGSGQVIMNNDTTTNSSINMTLPDEISDCVGSLTNDQGIVYTSNNSPIAVYVQAIERVDDVGMTSTAARTLVVVKNSNAPKTYTFNFTLSKGSRLIKSEDYYTDNTPNMDEGYIYIVDESNEITGVIEPAWAKDANGQSINTHYELNGNSLTQVIEFNELTKFPIVADPTKGDVTTQTYYLTKAQVKKVRDNYTRSSAYVVCKGISSMAIGYVNFPLGVAWGSICLLGDAYNNTMYSTWDTFYDTFHKKYLKITGKYRWHHKGAYVAIGGMNAKYVSSKS